MWIFVAIGVAILIVNIVFFVKLSSDIKSIPDAVEERLTKLDEVTVQLEQNINQLNQFNVRLTNIENNIEELTEKYPPNQTININDVSQTELNNAITNAVDLQFSTIYKKVQTSFILNIIFGSLLSVSFIGIAVYLWRKK